MKKALPVIIIILVLVGLGIWFLLQPSTVTVSPLALLPENSMAVARFFDLEHSIEQLQTGKFAQKLKEIDIEAVIAEQEVPEEDLEDLQERLDDFLNTVNSQWFKELFGQDVLIAVVPVSIKEFTPAAVEELLSSVVLVARPKHRAEMLGFISDLFTDETTVETITYEGHAIKHFTVEEDVPVYYSLVDGLLVGTLDRKTMEECLDRNDRQAPNLGDNERYAGTIERIERPDARMVSYVDVEKIYAFLSDSICAGVENEEDRSQVTHSLASMKGLRDMGTAFYDDGTEILEIKALVSFDKTAVDPLYAKVYSFAPEDNETLTMVAGDPLLYYWTNLLDLAMYWDFIMQSGSLEEQDQAALDANVQQQTGVSLEELFAALGNQIGLALIDINTSGFVPIPKLVLFMETQDQAVVGDVINSAVKKTMMQFQSEEYTGITIQSLPTPFGAEVQPAYAFLNGFCLISINSQLIRDAIDSHNSGEGLTKDSDFAAVDRGLSGKNNTLYFLDVKAGIEATRDVIEWQQQMAMFKDPEKAKESALVMEKVVYPLLESLQVVETIGARVVLGETEMEGYSYMKVDRGGNRE